MIAWLKKLFGLEPRPPVTEEVYDDSKERAICMNQPVITPKKRKQKQDQQIRAPQFKKRGRPRKNNNV